MTAAEAIAEEERLQGEQRAAELRSIELSGQVGQLKQRRAELVQEQVTLDKAEARGDHEAALGIEAIQEEQEEIAAELDRLTARTANAHTAAKEAEAELQTHRERELTVLAEDANEYTERAREELAAVEAPYTNAQAAWQEAEQRWARLGRAITKEVRALQEEQGLYSTRSVKATAPAFPLEDGESVFQRSREGSLLARPGAISDITNDD